MQKAKVYALEGSNIEKIHSDEDIALRVKAASTEKAWEGAGKAEGLEVWRVRDFKLEKLDDKDEGTFYAGDSYVVLRTRKVEDHLDWNIHFWLGRETSIDEAGVAAYKTVELDDLLGGRPVEYREVQGHESDLFLSYFQPSIKILQGGYASGFRHVTPETYTPRLLHVSGTAKRVNVVEVPLKASSLNNDDVFILDCGLKIYQWIGPGAGPFEKSKAAQTCARIDAERKGQPVVIVLDGKADESEFWKHLGGKQAVQNKLKEEVKQYQNALFRLSDASGQLKFEKVASGKFTRNMLDSNDSFIADAGNIVYVWRGAKCSKQEKKMAFPQAQTYLSKEGRPYYTTVTVVKEGSENAEFKALFA